MGFQERQRLRVEGESGAKATALQKLARSIRHPGIREAFGVRSL
jgi:hypothetical protein